MNEFEDRLCSLRLEIDDATRDRQLTAIRRELATHRRRLPRRRLVIALVTALMVLQVGVVWAAESALPGDPLYGIKTAYEAPRSLFDPDIRLRHRLEEAERLAESAPTGQVRTRSVQELLDAASDLTTPESDADLRRRLERLRRETATSTTTPAEREDAGEPPETTDGPTRDTTRSSTVDSTTTTTEAGRSTTTSTVGTRTTTTEGR